MLPNGRIMAETVTIPFLLTLNPTTQQEQTFKGILGGVRFAYNTTLAYVLKNWEANKDLPKEEQSYVSTHPYELAKWMVSVKDEIAPWNREYSKYVFQAGAENAGHAFQNFIKSRSGKIKSKAGLPRFKSRKNQNQVGCLFANVKLDGNKVFIPKVGWVKFYESNKTIIWLLSQGARLTQGTLKYQHARWTMSVNVKMSSELALKYFNGKYKTVQRKKNKVKGKTIGGDVGLKTFLTLSNNTTVENPRVYEKEMLKLRKLNKQLARRSRTASKTETVNETTGEITNPWSKRHEKTVVKLQKQHARLYNVRNNFLHNVSKQLIMNNDIIGLENLNIKGMIKNKHLSKQISDASWGEFIRQVEYKLERVGGTLVKTGRFMPSSKTCSNCGEVKTKLYLSERTFNCDKCGLSIDRDYNAALNIHAYTVQEARTLNLQVAGRLKARGVGSTGKKQEATQVDCETTLLGSEKQEETTSSRNAYKHSITGNGVKTTTLLA
jgi:putative transposase